MKDKLKPGMDLITLDGNRVSNAVVRRVHDTGGIDVISDFGNPLYFSNTEELFEFYALQEYFDEGQIEPLVDRLAKQIDLLTTALVEELDSQK